MADLLSVTGKATAKVSPDGVSIIFKGVDGQVFWPLSDWPDLRDMIDKRYNDKKLESKEVTDGS